MRIARAHNRASIGKGTEASIGIASIGIASIGIGTHSDTIPPLPLRPLSPSLTATAPVSAAPPAATITGTAVRSWSAVVTEPIITVPILVPVHVLAVAAHAARPAISR
jgi:hypothetical protein